MTKIHCLGLTKGLSSHLSQQIRERVRKPYLDEKEAGENIGFTNGKISKKDAKMTCSLCGMAGHNKRYHGVQVSVVLCACSVQHICITQVSCLINFTCKIKKLLLAISMERQVKVSLSIQKITLKIR